MPTARLLSAVLIAALFFPLPAPAASQIYPAPPAAYQSTAFTVAVDGRNSPVYLAKVAPGDDRRRWAAMDDIAHSAAIFEPAAFTAFESGGPADIAVTAARPIHSARILPTSAHIVPLLQGQSLRFTIPGPANLTLEINGDAVHSLHLFASAPSPPPAADPHVIYFGPGVHDVRNTIPVISGQTVYLAGGAIVRGVGGGGPLFSLHGRNITIRGAGMIDGGDCPTHSRNLVLARGCQDLLIDGIIFNDSPSWNLPIRQCDRVLVRNIKVLGHRANSDGIDICNSRDVHVANCFLRTLDDLVVVKSDSGQGPVHHVVVERCVLWNQVAHALSIGAELRENVDDVLFADCDVIHDVGREWTLRIYHCDAATVSNVRFENIRIEQSRRLISVWIGQAIWSRDSARGHVRDVLFRNIDAAGSPLTVDLHGSDADHAIDGVTFQDVVRNGKPLTATDVTRNPFVRNVVVEP